MVSHKEWVKKFPRHRDFSTKQKKIIAHKHRVKNKVSWTKLLF